MTIGKKSPEAVDSKIVHPIFKECSELTLDPYWQQIFTECSAGKFPRGSGISADGKSVYFYTKSTKQNSRNYVSYKLEGTTEQIFKSLKEHFQQQLNFKSKRDRQKTRDELNIMRKELQETFSGNWKKIRRKKIKDSIIRRYILSLKKKHDLNDNQTAEVAQILKLGFLFNWISNEDVVYENQQIVDIKTLHYDPEDRTFELDEPNVQYKREYNMPPAKLSGLFWKYMQNPKNRYLT